MDQLLYLFGIILDTISPSHTHLQLVKYSYLFCFYPLLHSLCFSHKKTRTRKQIMETMQMLYFYSSTFFPQNLPEFLF